MILIEKNQLKLVAPLFEGIDDSMVIACLQGYMGDVYVKTLERPGAALIVSGEYSFFGGDPDSDDAAYIARHIFDVIETGATTGIFADDKPAWETTLVAVAENNPQPVPRYGIVQKDYDFDQVRLVAFIGSLPEGFILAPFGEAIYRQAMAENWSREFCETFSSVEDYLKRGFGYAVLADGELVSGASTMTVYDGGAEMQVATREDHRRKGLGLSCAAALLKECTRRMMRPCWDAANPASMEMALKLGYEYKGEYITIRMSR